MFVCEKCGCNDERFLGIKNGKKYCRRCISFSGGKALPRQIDINEDLKENLSYALSLEQEEVSSKAKEAIANKKNVLIHAVCGAGKTEIVYASIAYCLSRGGQVGFCIPRKDVVIELEERVKSAFPNNKVIAVYGGNTSSLEGDIILLTTHQLYRYKRYFDLLIIDETDAFPFSNNETLMHMFEDSVRGNYIMMSATPLEWMEKKIVKEKGEYLKLMKRYHGHKLPVPIVKIMPFFKNMYVIKKLNEYTKKGYQAFVFCPSIDECEKTYKSIKYFVDSKGYYVHSKKVDRKEIIEQFKKGKYRFLITTSVLERGVTVKNIQVIVLDADNATYNEATLIQIAGRVGRKMDAYTGEVIFVCNKVNQSINNATKKIDEANEYVEL